MTPPPYPFDKVRLASLDAIEPALYKSWQNDPEISGPALGFRFPVQTESVIEWMEERRRNNGRSEVAFSIFFQDKGVGACFLRNLDWINRTAALGLYVGDRGFQAKGVGYCVCVLLLDYAFKALGLRRVSLEVIASNAPAIRLYEKLGFVHEGIARAQVLMDGQPVDVIRFGLLSSEFSAVVPEQGNRLLQR